MDFSTSITLNGVIQQFLIGLSRTTILFIVSSGLSLVLGVLRIPNVAHGSLYMLGAFLCYTIASFLGASSLGFWLAILLAPLAVALVSLAVERGLFCHLYDREHLMLLLFTFALMLIFGDIVKALWGSEYRSLSPPEVFQGSLSIMGMPFPKYNLFLLCAGPLVALALWFLTQKTKIGKIARAAAVDRDMVAAVGINVSWVFASVFVIGCYLAGLGGALSRIFKIFPGHGPYNNYGSFPYSNYRWFGQCLGGSSWRTDIRSYRIDGNIGLAAVFNRVSLCRCSYSAGL